MGKVNFLFSKKDNFVAIHVSGLIKDSVYKENMAKIFNSQELSDGYKGIIDTRMIEDVTGPSSDAMFQMARYGSDKKRKIAVVYASDLIYGLIRIYDSYNPNAEMNFFHDHEAAIKWLDIPESEEEITNFIKNSASEASQLKNDDP